MKKIFKLTLLLAALVGLIAAFTTTASAGSCRECGMDCEDINGGHDWSNADGECAYCGMTCDHYGYWSYWDGSLEIFPGVCQNCGYQCKHPNYRVDTQHCNCVDCGANISSLRITHLEEAIENLQAAVKAIEDDYLTAADKVALEAKITAEIAKAVAPLVKTADFNASLSQVNVGLSELTETMVKVLQTITLMEGRIEALEQAGAANEQTVTLTPEQVEEMIENALAEREANASTPVLSTLAEWFCKLVALIVRAAEWLFGQLRRLF